MTQEALKELAKKLYFENVKGLEWRNNFLSRLSTCTVFDKRNDGFYCCQCKKISKKDTAFTQLDNVIFPSLHNGEIWIVNEHYDGCRGWD